MAPRHKGGAFTHWQLHVGLGVGGCVGWGLGVGGFRGLGWVWVGGLGVGGWRVSGFGFFFGGGR